MRVLTLLIFFGCDWKQSSLYFSYLLQHFHSHYHILPLKSSWRWVRPRVTIAMLKGGGNCIPEGLSVLFKAAELVQDKTSLKLGFLTLRTLSLLYSHLTENKWVLWLSLLALSLRKQRNGPGKCPSSCHMWTCNSHTKIMMGHRGKALSSAFSPSGMRELDAQYSHSLLKEVKSMTRAMWVKAEEDNLTWGKKAKNVCFYHPYMPQERLPSWLGPFSKWGEGMSPCQEGSAGS